MPDLIKSQQTNNFKQRQLMDEILHKESMFRKTPSSTHRGRKMMNQYESVKVMKKQEFFGKPHQKSHDPCCHEGLADPNSSINLIKEASMTFLSIDEFESRMSNKQK